MGTQDPGPGHNEQSLREMVRQELNRITISENSAQDGKFASSGQKSDHQSSSPRDGAKGLKALRKIIHQELLDVQGNRNGSEGEKSGAQSSSREAGQAKSKDTNKSSGSQGNSRSSSGSSHASSSSQVGESRKSKRATVQPKVSGSTEQTVAQVLTQAQYELSQELETNLRKLRSVIRQSQEIAKKIELVLGHGNKGSGNK